MTDLQITCDNCGAKYKLPASFTGSQAKCQKCGSVIDVQKQRAAAAGAGDRAPAAAKPAAAARPAVDRSRQAPAEKPAAKPAAPASASSRRGQDRKAGDEPTASGSRRDRSERPERGKAKSSPMPIMMAGLGLLVIGGGAAFFLTRGENKPAIDATAKNDPAPAKPAVANPAPEAPKADAPKTDAAKTDAAPPAGDPKTAPTEPAKPPEAAPKDASAPAVPDDPNRVKKPWEKMANAPQSLDQVADPKSYGEVKWPEGTDAAKQTEIREFVEEVAGGGRPGIKAKPKLVAIGYLAMFGIVEKLRMLDYKSAEESQIAFEFNKMLEDITGGQNARFEPVEATEVLLPAKAEWNTRSVKGWLAELGKYSDEDAFKKAKAARLAKQADK